MANYKRFLLMTVMLVFSMTVTAAPAPTADGWLFGDVSFVKHLDDAPDWDMTAPVPAALRPVDEMPDDAPDERCASMGSGGVTGDISMMIATGVRGSPPFVWRS